MNRTPSKAFIYLIRIPLLLLIASSIGMGIFSRRGWSDWQRMVKKNEELDLRIEELHLQKTRLEHKITAFRSDRLFQERIIRSRLGYVREDEKVIQFD